MSDNQQKEKYAYCLECTKKQYNQQEGLLCALTGKKPVFEGSCPSFDGDIQKVREKLAKESSTSNTAKKEVIGGFLAFYLVIIGIGAVVSLLANLASFNYSDDYANNWALASTDIITWILYSGLSIYVIIAFHKRLPNAVSLARTQLIILVITNIITLIGGSTDTTSSFTSPSRLFGSILWAVIFFIYLSSSERVSNLIPPENRHFFKADKVCIFGTLGLILLLFIYGVIDVAGINPLVSKKARLDKEIEAIKAELPIEIGDYLLFTDIGIENEALVLTYKYPSISTSNFDYTKKKELGLMEKERFVSGLYKDKDDAFVDYFNAGYSLVARFLDDNYDHIYEYKLSNEEYWEAIQSTGTYHTRKDVLDEIMTLFNLGLPDDYVGGTILHKVETNVIGNGLIFNLTIPDLELDNLEYMTKSYLRNYLEENFSVITDDMMEIAYINNYDVTFRFDVDCSPFWSESITFTPKEYKKLIEF